MGYSMILASVVFLACFAATAKETDIVFADFEGKDYGDWKVTGDAFGTGPAQGTLSGQMKVTGFLGKGLVNSYHGGDKSTGTLTSPEFKISRKYVSFLIGGGGWEGKTCMNLLVDGNVVRTATGTNTQPGGSEALEVRFWDVSDLAGKTARIQIVDDATGGWGHINVDHVVLTDRRPALLLEQKREMTFEKRYLNFPVKNGAPKRRVAVMIDGNAVREFDIELADAEPDFWVFLDVSAFKSKQAVLRVGKLAEDSAALKSIEQGDSIKGAEDLYREKLRPQFHFTSRRGWNNDTNGMVYYKGEYHMFYQHNPYGWHWGNMHWGHAVSTDLVHWEELPIAIYPYKFGDWVFSGSAVVDWRNTSGFKSGPDEVLVAAFTSTGRGEAIAYSNDRGRTWTDYGGNPVVKHSGRDPRLLWHEPAKHWVMAVYDEDPNEPDKDKKRCIAFYTSPDLKAWQFQSRTHGFFECPDLFELPVDGKADNRKWVLTAASSEYMIGQFDGRKFTPETPRLPGHRGNAFYAAQTFSDIPPADGRRIQMGWGRMATPGMPFNQMVCFPCELTLRNTVDGVRMFWQPVKEIEKLRAKSHSLKAQELKPGETPLSGITGELLDIRAEFDVGQAEEVGLNVRGTPVAYNAKDRTIACKDHKVPLKLPDGKLRVQVLVDRTSFEIFAGDGLVYMPMAVTSKEEDKSLEAFSRGGTARIALLEVHELRSIWPAPKERGK